MPKRTFIYKKVKTMSDFKAFKDKLAVLFLAGFRLKPFVTGAVRIPGPSSLSISTHCQCPGQEIMMSWLLFQNTLLDYYATNMEKYYLGDNILFRFLLLIIFPDSLLSLVIFTPISNSCFSLYTQSL